jgi:phosphoglycerol transferase MdoB-like AlkP superfamily enzyme
MEALQALPTWALAAIGVLIVVDLVLYVYALMDLYRRPVDQLTVANKWVWVAIILLISTFGAIIYLLAGRKPAASADAPVQGATAERAENAADALYGAPKDADRR